MRIALVASAVVVCSFTLAAAQAPAPAVTKVAPPPTSVNVLNWPETQAVAGSVSVDNLPAVQTVGGTVNVGNLPLDADGALRVTSAPARHMVWYELLDSPISITGETLIPTSIDTDGYSSIGVRVSSTSGAVNAQFFWQLVDDEDFFQAFDGRNGSPGRCVLDGGAGGGNLLLCPIVGGKARVSLGPRYPPTTVSSVRVYLFP